MMYLGVKKRKILCSERGRKISDYNHLAKMLRPYSQALSTPQTTTKEMGRILMSVFHGHDAEAL